VLLQNIKIRVAFCHPTPFGNVAIDRVFNFVSCYRLLGFDRIFLRYGTVDCCPTPTAAEGVAREQLAPAENRCPYATLTERRDDDAEGRYHAQGVRPKSVRVAKGIRGGSTTGSWSETSTSTCT